MRIKNRITKFNKIAVAAVLAVTTFTSAVQAAPSDYNWTNVTPASWSNPSDYSGTMIWGEIKDTIAYEGGIWNGGRDADNKAALWRHDEITGSWTNEIPAGVASGDHRAVNALAVYGGKLYLATDNSYSGNNAEVWVKDNAGAAWAKVASFDTLNVRESHSMAVYDGSLCLAGDTSQFGVFCYNGTTWSDTDIEAAGAFYDAYRSTRLTVVGSKLYVDAQTGDDYYGIWEYNGDAWLRVQTPFTDEDEEGGQDAHYIRGLGAYDGTLVAVSVDKDTEATKVWKYNGTTWEQLGEDNFNGDEAYYNFSYVGTHDNKLIVGVGGYGESAWLWEYNSGNDSFVKVNAEYFGVVNSDGFTPNFVTSMTSSNEILYVATAITGEGEYYPQIWRSQPLEITDDGNNNNDNVLPNGGDLNNDGVVDTEQDNVSSFKSSVSDKYVALEVSSQCSVESAFMQSYNDLDGRDAAYEYLNGLMNFGIECGAPGFTATITQYYYDVTKADLVLRKYMPTTNAFFTVQGAATEQLTIDGRTVTKATYQVTDGGALDVDGEENGAIVDPAGLARNTVGTPRTGFGK